MNTGRLLRTTLLLVLLVLPLRLWATGLIESQAYFEDPTGKLTFADVQDKRFTPYTGILTKGFTDSVFWLRLRIDPALVNARPEVSPAGGFPPAIHVPSGESDKLVLRVRPPSLDQIELFDPLEPHRLNRITGNVMPWAESEFASLNHGFVIPKGDEPRDVWLRVAATSTMLIGVDVLPYDEMRALEKRQEILNTLDLALALFFIVWAALTFAMRPDRLVGAFLLVMVVSFFYASNYTGYYRIFMGEVLSESWLDKFHSFLVMLMLASYMLFNRRILADYRPKSWMLALLLPVQYYFVLGGLLVLAGYETLALMVNASIAMLGQFWVCLILLYGAGSADRAAEHDPVLPRGWVLAYSFLLMFLFGGLALPGLGLFEATSTSLYRTIIQGAVPFVFMAVIVHLRNKRLDREQQQQIAQAEQEAAFEKSRREDSEQFLAMLTHEIRTPLTVMAYAAKTSMSGEQLGKHVQSGIREIDDLVERCVQADRADQPSLPVLHADVPVHLIIDDMKSRFIGAQVQWQMDLPEDFLIRTDVTLLEVILNNLIDNALKYSPSNESVRFVVKRLRDASTTTTVFSVSNLPGSAGFPDPQRVFDKYYRAPRAHLRTGSGLGLYVARSFATKLGGQLIYRREGERICFDLLLPD
ncbi:MAG: ATP-binding protein [Burkholderiaceae bacterium]|nr:ATP-binding protein [Burkholderiaceae bacterium]MCD8518047.1 ATP-binding protein [Burkholderiaceae bacterium]MCD8538131.1 ATP-binding protein [Burkholderiaceae bacterium]